MPKIDKNDVMHEASIVAKQAMDRLAKAEADLHNQGYNQWSAAVSNMRTKIERSLLDLVEEVDV